MKPSQGISALSQSLLKKKSYLNFHEIGRKTLLLPRFLLFVNWMLFCDNSNVYSNVYILKCQVGVPHTVDQSLGRFILGNLLSFQIMTKYLHPPISPCMSSWILQCPIVMFNTKKNNKAAFCQTCQYFSVILCLIFRILTHL